MLCNPSSGQHDTSSFGFCTSLFIVAFSLSLLTVFHHRFPSMEDDFIPDPLPNIRLLDNYPNPSGELDNLGLRAYELEIAEPFLLGFYEFERDIEPGKPYYKIGDLIYRRIVKWPRHLVPACLLPGANIADTPVAEPVIEEWWTDLLDGPLTDNPSDETLGRLSAIFPNATGFDLLRCRTHRVSGIGDSLDGYLFVGYNSHQDVIAHYPKSRHYNIVGGFVARACLRSYQNAAVNAHFRFQEPPAAGLPVQPHTHDHDNVKMLRPGFCSISPTHIRSCVGMQITTSDCRSYILSSLHPLLRKPQSNLWGRLRRWLFFKTSRMFASNDGARLVGLPLYHVCQNNRLRTMYGSVARIVEDDTKGLNDMNDTSVHDLVLVSPSEGVSVNNSVHNLSLSGFGDLMRLPWDFLLESHPEHLGLSGVRMRIVSKAIVTSRGVNMRGVTCLTSHQAKDLFESCQSPVFDPRTGTVYSVIRFLNTVSGEESSESYEVVLLPLHSVIVNSELTPSVRK